MSATYFTVWVDFAHGTRYGGRLSHTASDTMPTTLCGRFSRYELGHFTKNHATDAPTCKKCRDSDPRFRGQP